MDYFSTIKKRKGSLISFFCLILAGIAAASYLVPSEINQLSWEVPGTPDQYPFVYSIRPWLVGIACFIPCLVSLYLLFGRILDRYMLLNILNTFALTTGVIFLIWLLGDFSENVSDITSMDSPLEGLFLFYANQIPMVLSLILPYSLLLATLWSLSTLSRNCEITPMLQTGSGLMRITLPILFVGFLTSVYTTIFNYQWAPSANLYRRLTLEDIHRTKHNRTDPIVYRNDINNRIWTIDEIPRMDKRHASFKGIHIEQFSSPGKLSVEYFADKADWNQASREWTLTNVTTRTHRDDEEILMFEGNGAVRESLILPYQETPWMLITPGVKIDTRSVPDLVKNLEEKSVNYSDRKAFRTHKYLRFAQGFSAFVLVLLAIPGGINFSRRATLSGIGIALGLSGCMIFGFEIFPAIASAGYLPPFLGAWLPNIIFTMIALVLFYSKLAHRNFSDYLPWKRKKNTAE